MHPLLISELAALHQRALLADAERQSRTAAARRGPGRRAVAVLVLASVLLALFASTVRHAGAVATCVAAATTPHVCPPARRIAEAVRRAETPAAGTTGITAAACAAVPGLAPPVAAGLSPVLTDLSGKGPLPNLRAPEPFSPMVERLALGCTREGEARPAPLPESCHWRVDGCRSPGGFADLGEPGTQLRRAQGIR